MITSDNKSEGSEEVEEITIESIEEIINNLQGNAKIKYLSEPILNSELILFNNEKLLRSSTKKNINNLSRNYILGKCVNKSVTSKKGNNQTLSFEISDFSKVYSKMAFMVAKPKYNSKYLDKVLDLRASYEKLDCDDSPGLQKIKRDIRNEIRDLSTKTYIYRDKNIFAEMIIKVMDKIISRPNFSGYSYKDEMKSLATEHILKYTWRFASYKQSKISGQYVSSFTYVSTIIFNAFVATINKQKDEHQKAKDEFLETQIMKHKDHHVSTYGDNSSTIDKEVKITVINTDLFAEIKKIMLDCKDILVKYPKEYKINMEEYNLITQYSTDNNINLSIIRV